MNAFGVYPSTSTDHLVPHSAHVWRPWAVTRGNAPVWRRRTRDGFVFTNLRDDVASGMAFSRPYAALDVRISPQGPVLSRVSLRYRSARLTLIMRSAISLPFLVGCFVWVGQGSRPAAWVASAISLVVLIATGRNSSEGAHQYRTRAHQLERSLAPTIGALLPGSDSPSDITPWVPDPRDAADGS
jgi:uncharacterized membrane protein YphA (DoxX/SURF4 family)